MTNPRLIDSKLIKLPCSDLKAVNSARVSMHVTHDTFDTDGDTKLINYLASHKHWSPFSHNRDTIFFKVESRAIYNAFITMITTGLSIEEKTSMVIQDNLTINRENYIAIKTSFFGWVNIIKRLLDSYIAADGYTIELIISVLYNKYPVSTRAYFEEHIITSYLSDLEYINNLNNLNSALPELERKMFDITLYETVPIFVARQRFKAMVSHAYNEVSKRYVDSIPSLYAPIAWSQRPEKNIKQGAGDKHPDNVMIGKEYEKFCNTVLEYYDKMINDYKVAPEQARMVLPQSMMTEYYVTCSLDAVDRFIAQRQDGHAQKEIRDLADITDRIITECNNMLNHKTRVNGTITISDMEDIGIF